MPTTLSRITSLLAEIDGEKRAAETELEHSGSGSKDPGGHQGASTHPSAKLDGHTQAAPLGARFRENHEDMTGKRALGNVDRTDGAGGGQDKRQFNIGTRQSATGEDPKTEDNYKSDKEDPGTTHPANANTLGEKYGAEAAAQRYATMSPLELTKQAYDRMNEVLADLANGVHLKNRPATNDPTKTAAANDATLAANAGYELAGVVAGPQMEAMEKAAFIQSMAEEFIKQAAEDADDVGAYLLQYSTERNRIKRAEGEMPPPGGPPMPLEEGADGGGGPMPSMPPPGMGGGDPGAGGPSMPSMMGGGDPGAGPGGPSMPGGPGGPEGGGAGGPGGHEEALNELANALMELGLPPEELEKLVAHLGGGGGGGEMPAGPGPVGGGPEAGPEGEPSGKEAAARREEYSQLRKYAGDVKKFMKAGKARFKETKSAKARQERDEIKNYLLEVCRR